MEKVDLDGVEFIVENGIYTPVIKTNTFEEMGGAYVPEYPNENDKENFFLVPYIEEEEPEEIKWGKLNIFGRARKKFLEEERPQEFERMLYNNTLFDNIMELQERCDEYYERELPKMKKTWGITEELKQADQMAWVGLMNNLVHTLREMILKEMVYV